MFRAIGLLKYNSTPLLRQQHPHHFRKLCNKPQLTQNQLRSALNDFQDLFTEARLSISDVQESIDTTYYEEDLAAAGEATSAAINAYADLLSKVDPDKAGEVERQNGMKVRQLEEELTVVAEHYKDDH